MRTSVLSRPVVALATIAVASATLAAAPATAATPSGVTRDQVLTAANGLRAAYASNNDPSKETTKAVRAIVQRACGVSTDDGEVVYAVDGIPLTSAAPADGLVVYGEIYNLVENTARDCVAGAVASATTDRALTGSATLSIKTKPLNQVATVTDPLSGDVAVTRPISAGTDVFLDEPTLTASGAATKTVKVPATTVKDVKTRSEKKAAKKKYAKKLAAAKSKYAKALKKAGSSKSRKAAAKKAYAARKTSARNAYRYAIADYRIVTKARTTQDAQPFNVTLLTF